MLRDVLLLFFLQLLLILAVRSKPTHICKSIEIRNVMDFESLQNCRIVVGHVSIINLQDPVSSSSVFSAVEEITDYLVVHRSHGLKTLQHIFPRLVLIRGRELLFTKYALVVYENRYLLDLGLISMLRIQNGDIRIEANPILCFVHTINWVYLMGNITLQHFSLKKNMSPNYCPNCIIPPASNLIEDDMSEPINQRCWNFGAYQREAVLVNCPIACGTAGCNNHGSCCNRNCLSGCAANECRMCANLQLGQKCVDTCVWPFYQLNKRECVPESVCRQNNLLPHAGVCVERCPEHFEQQMDTLGHTICNPICKGLFVVHTSRDLEGLRDCYSIQGSLIIELTEIKSRIVLDLERELINIREITGYLKVVNSPQLMSLSFLRKLDTIRGDELIANKYAFYVVDNYNLEQIWASNHNVSIFKGHVYFHLNPRLCHDKVMQLQGALMSGEKISGADASYNSNGERVVCGDSLGVLETNVEDINATAARIKVSPMPYDNMYVLIGYLFHYKEAPLKNITMYDGRHGCGHDNWLMDVSPTVNVRHIIAGLKPFTQYAYFVKTFTMTDYHTQYEAYSDIKYFRTLPTKPGPIAKIYYHSLSATELAVHWWPPRNTNGIIKNYIIFYEIVEAPSQNSTDNDDSRTKSDVMDTCECHTLSPDDSGPLPQVETYYNKEQIIYDEALADHIFVHVSRKIDFPKKTKNTITSKSSELETTESSSTASFISESSSNLPSTPSTSTSYTSSTTTLSTTTISSSSTSSSTPSSITSSSTPLSTIISSSATSSTTPPPTSSTTLSTTTLSSSSTLASSTTTSASPHNNVQQTDKEAAQAAQEEEIIKQMDLRLKNYRLALENDWLRQQDTGIEDFLILKPLPVCLYENVSVQYQLENSCKVKESFDGTVVDGHIHSYILDNLEPVISYRISVRACVAGMENGCGCETSTVAKTVGKDMETFLRGFKRFSTL